MCIIELVDYNENMLAAKVPSKAKPSRRRSPKKKKAVEAGSNIEEAELVQEDILENKPEEMTQEEEKPKPTGKRAKAPKAKDKPDHEDINEKEIEDSEKNPET